MRTRSKSLTLSTLVAVVMCLGLVGSVSAEGACVLWTETKNVSDRGTQMGPATWMRVSAHSSSQECERHGQERAAETPYRVMDSKGASGLVKVTVDNTVRVRFPDYLAVIRYSCWPETIDP